MCTMLFFLILITEHPPLVVSLSSKSFIIFLFIKLIWMSFKSSMIIIGALFFEDKFKFSIFNVTELEVITMFPWSVFPLTVYTPGFSITTSVS